MQFGQLNRTDTEKIYIVCQNVAGATLSAGAAVFFTNPITGADADTTKVSGARTSMARLFAGVLPSALSDSSYGLVQVYGLASCYIVLSDTGASAIPGDGLLAVNSQTYLVDFSAISTPSKEYENWVTLMDYYSAAAGGQSTPLLKQVLVRAL